MKNQLFNFTLQIGESYTNNTSKEKFYKVSYYNFLGHKQTDTKKLAPAQTIVNNNPFTKITIID